jgi:hypothetical protein
MPGLVWAQSHQPDSTEQARFENVSGSIKTYRLAYGASDIAQNTVAIPIVFIVDPETVSLGEYRIFAEELRVLEVKGKPFRYVVSGLVCVDNVAPMRPSFGGEVKMIFTDTKGDGVFDLLELPGWVDPKRPSHSELPRWIYSR